MRSSGSQHAAYARNRRLLGVEPLPLQADYREIFRTMEVWVADADGGIGGVLILEPNPDHMLIWSIATEPAAQTSGLGHAMLLAAEDQARTRGLRVMRLYTGTTLEHLVAWYGRNGYIVERIEQRTDRSVTHMMKQLD